MFVSMVHGALSMAAGVGSGNGVFMQRLAGASCRKRTHGCARSLFALPVAVLALLLGSVLPRKDAACTSGCCS